MIPEKELSTVELGHAGPALDPHIEPTQISTEAILGQLGVRLLWLSERCPELNPMEVRGQVKGIVSANKQYATIDEQIERFIGYLGILSTDDALRTSGMRPENF